VLVSPIAFEDGAMLAVIADLSLKELSQAVAAYKVAQWVVRFGGAAKVVALNQRSGLYLPVQGAVYGRNRSDPHPPFRTVIFTSTGRP
jgi:hypothetical protein